MDINRFYNGTCYDAYKWLGAQVQPVGVVFRTYAPNARGVNLLWNGMEIPMQKIWGGSFYEVYVEAARPTECYEYRIYTQSENMQIIVILMDLACKCARIISQ